MAQDPYKYFRVEAGELAQLMGKGVLDLEKGAMAPDLVSQLLRYAHTLKGAARVVKQREIADQAHAIEEVLSPFRETTTAFPKDGIDALFKLLDGIGGRIKALARPPEAEEVPAAGRPPDNAFRLVRPDSGEMDVLLDGVTEAHAQLGHVRKSQSSVGVALQAARLIGEKLMASGSRGPGSSSGGPVARQAHAMAEELERFLTGVERSLALSLDQLERELRQVRDAAEQLRLVPATGLFASLERAVRDVAHAQGKQIVFEGRGDDVRLDAPVLDAVQWALIQVVRNAAAHGIEPPADRKQAGKPPAGHVTLDVSRKGRHVAFTCTDDGRGVDVAAVRRAAQKKGLSLRGDMDADAVLRLLLKGGISTSGTVTEISGRGIGLDVLKEAAERVGGSVSMRTVAGKETSVELLVPISVASLDGLLVETAGTVVAVPIRAVRNTLRMPQADIQRDAEGEFVQYEGKVIRFAPLAKVLRIESRTGKTPAWSVVLVQGPAGMAAIGVDRLVGTANLILRPLPDFVPAMAVVAGASLDAEGNPQLILDPDCLIAAVRATEAADDNAEVQPHHVLVIDDSLTTRMLEQSILESAGYLVDVAPSGEDAIDKARLKPYSLFLVDVEMPGMDGFTFIERTRADPTFRDIPCILVSSRASPEDLRRGQEAGALGYIIKSEFNQNELLERIHQLVG